MKMIENWDKLKISCQRNSNVTKIKYFTPQSDQVTNPFFVDKLKVKKYLCNTIFKLQIFKLQIKLQIHLLLIN